MLNYGHIADSCFAQKNQLGRQDDGHSEKWGPWFARPGLVPGIGSRHGRRATWIGASGDQTFLRIDESLINAHTLAKSNIFANNSCIGEGLLFSSTDPLMLFKTFVNFLRQPKIN